MKRRTSGVHAGIIHSRDLEAWNEVQPSVSYCPGCLLLQSVKPAILRILHVDCGRWRSIPYWDARSDRKQPFALVRRNSSSWFVIDLSGHNPIRQLDVPTLW